MAYFYILENRLGRHYCGITSLSPEKRLGRHNRGEVVSTKFDGPWKIIYCEKFDSMALARVREKQVKSWKGGNALKKFLEKK